MKICNACQSIKDSSLFYKNARNKDGLSTYCKDCCRQKAKKWREQNPEKARAHHAGREEYFKKWRQEHTVYHRQKSSEWAKQNKQKRILNENKRRAAKLAGGEYTLEEWIALCEKYEYKCLACGIASDKLTVDHVEPLSKGGRNDIGNIQPLCLVCNVKKSNKNIDYRGK